MDRADPAARTGWLGALQDRQIGRAIALIHRDPARDWTVDALAAEIAMSRSAFAARFTELVGEPAMQYVTRWRMHVAVDDSRRRATSPSSRAGSATAPRPPSPRVQAPSATPPGAVRRLPDALQELAAA